MTKRRLAAGRFAALAGAVLLLGSLVAAPPEAVAATPLPPVLSILPPGENGLVNPLQAVLAQLGQRPPSSSDQTAPYAGLLYAPGLTDQALTTYYNAETLGTPPDVSRVETLWPPTGSVTITRDTHDVPHIKGSDPVALGFGAGYAAAEDRLFLMDVLRHYGAGTLTAFLGPTCANEQMDHDQLLAAPYTDAQRQAQVDSLPLTYGAQGALLVAMATSYVAGINQYIAESRLDLSKLPADYASTSTPLPQPFTAADVISSASLVGGLLGKGGGAELRNAALYQHLLKVAPDAADAKAILADLRQQNDPEAPTTIRDQSFPYETPTSAATTIDPSTTALPDDARATLAAMGVPGADEPDCPGAPNPVSAVVSPLLNAVAALPAALGNIGHSNALVVDAAHSVDGHPLAVFGPQVSYFAPQVLMQEDLQAPGISAAGVAFPGTGFVVEMGRGQNYAWSATSAGTDNIDVRLEVLCDPAGGPVSAREPFYLFNGACVPMDHQSFTLTALPTVASISAGGILPRLITHDTYLTGHGVVQGWSTASGGKPVAVVAQRSTYNHEVDSGIGFLAWNQPAATHDAASFIAGASNVGYTFNWFYLDAAHIAYAVSGRDPSRFPTADPTLPTWGTGATEWQGFLSPAAHPHEVDPPQGWFTSWNNKPAPGFSAADNQYGYGPVFRSQSLDRAIARQLSLKGGHLTRADLVSAMESAATVDLTGAAVLPELLATVNPASQPPPVQAMLTELGAWLADGAARKKAAPGDAQYRHAGAVAAMDHLEVQLAQALFGTVLGDLTLGNGGLDVVDGVPYDYARLPMVFADTPNSRGAHLGSAYDSGYESYVVKALRLMRGAPVAAPFGAALSFRLCGGGLAACGAAVATALQQTASDLAAANGGSTDPASWTVSPALANANRAAAVAFPPGAPQTMPQYDAIAFRTLGLIGQPSLDWQNRPTFQQVVEFPG
ncbi:MAG: hypothetical protein QOG36_1350 [Actinomycetota bacterium]|nr:hypothetical protein [Actinomycetota bacterium]